MSKFKQADINILKWIYQRPYKRTWFIKALIFIGDGPSWMLVIFFSALFSQLTDAPIFGMLANLLIIGFIIGNATFVPMKEKIHRRRPYANITLQKELGLAIINRDPGHGSKELESFPSGHALWTTMSVIIICFQFGWPAFILLGWLVPIMILLRPYLGVHYPSDVLFGSALGAMFAGIAIGSAPFVAESLSYLQQQLGAFYYLGYWAFITLFMYKGMRSWLRRV